jgi:hypothetical protein
MAHLPEADAAAHAQRGLVAREDLAQHALLMARIGTASTRRRRSPGAAGSPTFNASRATCCAV